MGQLPLGHEEVDDLGIHPVEAEDDEAPGRGLGTTRLHEQDERREREEAASPHRVLARPNPARGQGSGARVLANDTRRAGELPAEARAHETDAGPPSALYYRSLPSFFFWTGCHPGATLARGVGCCGATRIRRLLGVVLLTVITGAGMATGADAPGLFRT